MTYSIVARDPESGQFGIAVQSHFLAVGAAVPSIKAGVGAVASQANLRIEYKDLGLKYLANGDSAGTALRKCLATDPNPEVRQVAIIDSVGNTAAHTGSACWNEASHYSKFGVSAQSNMVSSALIPEAMVNAFEKSTESFPFRLLAALDVAESLGGDLRGQQSAAILIAGDQEASEEHPALDLRVDNDAEPLVSLRKAVRIALAFAPMWRVIRGPACRGVAAPTNAETEEAIAVLQRAQTEYGVENLEPTFWLAVAKWRGNSQSEAEQLVSEIAKSNSGWTRLFQDVISR
ncbi:MAG: DUF1028 domain-containing protein [Cryobacterium sp.]|nr:DUF1028 domain-containing protein [Cryobacterium sp.]